MDSYNSIGFIGVGAMGKEMVDNLARKLPSTQIFIHDVNQDAINTLIAARPSLVACATAREVAEQSSLTFTMLPEGHHVRLVYLDGPNCIASSSPSKLAHKLLLDCSTIDTATSLDISAALRRLHPSTSFYDTPVSGGVLGARDATLGIFIGCTESDPNFPPLNALLLSTVASSVIPCGGPSLGLVAKLANNYLSGTIAIATAEAMNMGMRAGVDARVLARVISAGSGKNHIADKFNPVPGICPAAPSSRGYQGGFRVELMRKDVGLATEMAERVGARLVLGEAVMGAYEGASGDPRCAGRDSRVVYRYLGGEEEWEGKEGKEG